MALVSVGLAVGVLLAIAVGAAVRGLVYQVSERDPVSFVGAAALLSVTSLLACYLPALRATRVEPTQALRSL
jgi:putative ABC transport system permease protein